MDFVSLPLFLPRAIDRLVIDLLTPGILGYHYQHSGAHGAIGLALIQSGLHEDSKKTQGGRTSGMHSASHSAPNTQPPSPVTSTPTSPLHTPMAMHHHQPFFGSSQDVNMG